MILYFPFFIFDVSISITSTYNRSVTPAALVTPAAGLADLCDTALARFLFPFPPSLVHFNMEHFIRQLFYNLPVFPLLPHHMLHHILGPLYLQHGPNRKGLLVFAFFLSFSRNKQFCWEVLNLQVTHMHFKGFVLSNVIYIRFPLKDLFLRVCVCV